MAYGMQIPTRLKLVTSERAIRLCCYLVTFTLFLFCINAAVLSCLGGYDVRYGPIHLPAHGLFKPVLMMNTSFILMLAVCGLIVHKKPFQKTKLMNESAVTCNRLFLAASTSLIVLALYYYGSAQINFADHDWTHRHISAGMNSFHSFCQLFTKRQGDSFYRPLTFISLWMDFRLFGTWYPGYHLQSIVLHIINSLLAAGLASALGFGRRGALWTGLFFAGAAVNFEPVLWPAARFDLLATAFTLTALILALRYFKYADRWTWELTISHVCFALGILNKESSYCLPLLVFFIVCTHKVWPIPPPQIGKLLSYFLPALVIALFMVLIRLAVFGNLGGYLFSVATESAHFKFGFKTVIYLLRVVPLSIFGVNTTSSAPSWLPILVIAFTAFVFAAAIASRGGWGKKEYSLLVCIFISAIPVANIAGWIGPSMQHSRYLYMPAVFTMLLMFSVLQKTHFSMAFLGIYFLLNAAGANASLSSYRNMLGRTETIAESVRLDYLRRPAIKTIYLVDLPDSANGVFFIGSELVERIRRKVPNAAIVRLESSGSSVVPTEGLVYIWSSANRALMPVP